ncbi:MAG: hypothetical protein ACOCUA_02940 [archaeon]
MSDIDEIAVDVELDTTTVVEQLRTIAGALYDAADKIEGGGADE